MAALLSLPPESVRRPKPCGLFERLGQKGRAAEYRGPANSIYKMHITFIQSGGFTGVVRRKTASLSDLGARERKGLEALLHSSPQSSQGKTADLTLYHLLVEDSATHVTREFFLTDLTVSDEVRPLIDFFKR